MNNGLANKERVIGVFWDKRKNRWCANIKTNGKNVFLGYFQDKNDAILCRKNYEIKHKIAEKRQNKQIEREKFKEEVISLFNAGKSATEIAKIFNKDTSTISDLLKRMGYKSTVKLNLNTTLIKELYNQELSIGKIAKHLNVSSWVVSSRLKELNLEVRPNRKHFFDLNFMKEINEEWKAYFLGFMFADGNVRKDFLAATISISKKDEEVVNYLESKIQTNNIKYSPATTYINKKNGKIVNCSSKIILRMCSNEICIDLQQFGCTPQKSLTAKWPTNIPPNMIRHFIRGYFDGDGYISRDGKRVMMVCSHSFAKSLKIFLKKELNISVTNYKCKNITRSNIWRKSDVKIFKEFLYKESEFSLKRKYDRFL